MGSKKLPLSRRRLSRRKLFVWRRKMLKEMAQRMQVDRDTENESTDPLNSVKLPSNVTNSEINTEMIHCHKIKEEPTDNNEGKIDTHNEEGVCNGNIEYYCHKIKEEPTDNNEGKIETHNEEGVCNGNIEYYCHQIKKEPTDNNQGQIETYNEEGVCSGNIEYCGENKNLVFVNVDKINETEGYKEEGACNETIEYCEDNNKDLVSINIDNMEKAEGYTKESTHNQSTGHSEATKDIIINNTCSVNTCSTQEDIPTRPIVNFSFMWSEIHRTFKKHMRVVNCQFKYWKLIHYSRRGLRTQFFFRCQRCFYETSVWSDPINFEGTFLQAAQTGRSSGKK